MIGMAFMPIILEAQAAPVPNSSILIVDRERLYEQSAFGQRVIAERDAEVAVLAAEYRRIEAELTEEERILTDKRPTMAAEEFRKLADAFDERVEEIRDLQQIREIEIATKSEAEQRRFFEEIQPVVGIVMRESGAQLMLEIRDIFAHNRALDVTDQMILQANVILGDGTQSPEDVETEEN